MTLVGVPLFRSINVQESATINTSQISDDRRNKKFLADFYVIFRVMDLIEGSCLGSEREVPNMVHM